MQPYFIWKGIDCRTMGVMVEAYPSVVLPKERVTTVTVPGRQGVLTLPEVPGEPMYDERLLSIKCYVRPEADMGAVLSWLSGSGLLVLGCDAGHCYKGRIAQAVNFDYIIRSTSFRRFTLPVACQPFVYQWPVQDDDRVMFEDSGAHTSGSMIIHNPGLRAPLRCTVYGGGYLEMWVMSAQDPAGIGVQLLDISGAVRMDWDTGEAWQLDDTGNPAQLVTHKIRLWRSGALIEDVPSLVPGDTTITAAPGEYGGTLRNIIVHPEWRWMA